MCIDEERLRPERAVNLAAGKKQTKKTPEK